MTFLAFIFVSAVAWLALNKLIRRQKTRQTQIVLPSWLARDPEFQQELHEAIDRAAARKWIGERMKQT